MSVVSTSEWFDRRLGSGWFARTTRAHDPSWPDEPDPNGWYSVRSEFETLKIAHTQLEGYDSVEHMMAEATAEIARADLQGILRAFLWVVSPKMFLSTAPRIWATYANFTKIEIVENVNERFVAKITEIPADIVGWIAAIWMGFLPPAVESAGGRDPSATIEERRQTPGAETWEILYVLSYSR